MSKEERLQVLRDAPPNSWLALAEDESRVVGQGSTYLEAVKQASDHGEEDPIMIMTPDSWVPMILDSGSCR